MEDLLKVTGIKCDNESCDYKDDSVTFDQYPDYLNKPCPKCGANLLTQEDLDTAKTLIAVFNSPEMKALNEAYKQAGAKTVEGNIEMNGTGKADIKIDKEDK